MAVFGYNGGQQDVTQAVDGLLIEVILVEIEFESAFKVLYPAGKLCFVETGYLICGLF